MYNRIRVKKFYRKWCTNFSMKTAQKHVHKYYRQTDKCGNFGFPGLCEGMQKLHYSKQCTDTLILFM